MSDVMAPVATVVITTKNRKDDLAKAVQSAVTQSVPVEVLVIDDGSSDGTAEMIRSQFPQVRLIRHEESSGYIVRRNEGARLASAPIIFSIDDDAEFSTPNVVEQTLRDFDDPRIGAVAIPFINVRQDQVVRQQAPDNQTIWVCGSYIGTAHAIRRDLFLSLAGYREELIHQGEEGDFCIRMLNVGHFVRLGRTDAIYHYESPKRDLTRMHYYGSRNSVVFVWQNVPMPYVMWHLPCTIGLNLLAGIRMGALRIKTRAVFHGILSSCSARFARRPVAPGIYRLNRVLRRAGAMPLSQVTDRGALA